MSWFKSLYVRVREKTNPFLGPIRRMRLSCTSFTIISNNCWAGHCYRFFSLPYNTPTVGLYFFSDEYIRFVSNLKYYMSRDLCFINAEQSKYYHILVERGETNVPIGILDDVEIVFLHYKTEEEVKEKWERRKQRIDWDNIYFKFSEMNLCRKEHLETFNQLPTENKFVFTAQKYDDIGCAIYYKVGSDGKEVYNDTVYFSRGLKLVDFLNKKLWK